MSPNVPPTPLAVELEAGARQCCARAEREWLAALHDCPACGATTPGDRRPSKLVPGTPFCEPRAHAKALSFQDLVRARKPGPLQRTRLEDRCIEGPGGYGFRSYEVAVFCTACGWASRLTLTDSPPMHSSSARLADKPFGPRTAWSIVGLDGAPAGTVFVGGGAPSTMEASPGADPDTRATLSLAAVYIDIVSRVDLSPLPETHARRTARAVVDSLLRLRGVRLAEGAGTSRV